MIQRTQSVYLLLASILLGLEFSIADVWTGSATARYSWFEPVSLGMFAIATAGALVSIFLYKDRNRQRRMVIMLQYLTLTGLCMLFAGLYMGSGLPDVADNSSFWTWAAITSPILAYLMFLMGRRAIEKDIALVRSMDRLR